LTGLLKCGGCGGAIIGGSANGSGGKYHYYTCRNTKVKKDACGMKSIRQEVLEKLVISAIKDKILTPANMKDFVKIVNSHIKDEWASAQTEQAELKAEMMQIHDKIFNISGFIQNNRTASKALAESLTTLHERKEYIHARLEDLEQVEPPYIGDNEILKYAADMAAMIKDSSPKVLKIFLQEFVENIRVCPDGIEITYNLPIDASGGRTEVRLKRLLAPGITQKTNYLTRTIRIPFYIGKKAV
jgi:hypothetical protein